MEVRVADCPLGAKCEEVREVEGRQVLFRCPWYVKLDGTDAQGHKRDEWACAIAWGPILHLEVAKEARAGSAATESFRNEMVDRIDQARLNARVRQPIVLEAHGGNEA